IHNGEYLPFGESGSCDGHSSEKKFGQDSTPVKSLSVLGYYADLDQLLIIRTSVG
ncbi:hypothetical protein Tco_0391431, partial [Tanacetum coccineum]